MVVLTMLSVTVSIVTLSPGLHEEDERGQRPRGHEGQGQDHLWQPPSDLRLAQRVSVLYNQFATLPVFFSDRNDVNLVRDS